MSDDDKVDGEIVMLVAIFLLLLMALLLSGDANASTTLSAAPRHDPTLTQAAPRGRWYLAASGRAVHCYGPVVKVGGMDGLPHLYATRCLPGSMTVRLRE